MQTQEFLFEAIDDNSQSNQVSQAKGEGKGVLFRTLRDDGTQDYSNIQF